MSSYKELAMAFLPPRGILYEDVGEHILRIINGSGDIYIVFDSDNDNRAQFLYRKIASVPEEKLDAAIYTCNRVNIEYRWFKLYVDEDRDYNMRGDAIFSAENVGEVCAEMVLRMLRVSADLFPALM